MINAGIASEVAAQILNKVRGNNRLSMTTRGQEIARSPISTGTRIALADAGCRAAQSSEAGLDRAAEVSGRISILDIGQAIAARRQQNGSQHQRNS